MEKMLKKISMELYFFEKNKKITIRQVSDLPVGLKGDVSGLTGNVSGLRGDVDACKITTEERNLGLEIKTLILEE